MIPQGCKPENTIKELIAHGADFVFLGFADVSDINSVAKNIHDIPIFISSRSNESDPF